MKLMSRCRRRLRRVGFVVVPAMLPAAAMAQSSVTLYGVVDTSVEYVTNVSTVAPTAANGFTRGPGGNAARMTSGGLSGARWGLRGVEDLGTGLKAVYALESGYGSDDGKLQQGGRLFGRQAFVGLDQAGIGRLSFGRQYTSLFDILTNFSPTAFSLQYEPLVQETGQNFRSDNVVKYAGQFGGLTVTGHWSFGNGVAGAGEVPGQFRRDSAFGGGLAYNSGAFGAAIAYDQFNPTLSATGDTGSTRKAAAAASYTAGNFKLTGGYRWGKNTGTDGGTLVRDNFYWIGGNYQVTGALTLTLAYYYDNFKRFAGSNVKSPWQLTFIADYNLSKRTDVYLTTAYVRNGGIDFDNSSISYANGYPPGTDKNGMFAAALGIRHRF